MKELVLIKCGEIALKGLNRATFEDMLIKNCKRRLETIGKTKFYKAQSTIYCEPVGDCNLEEVVPCLEKVFGIAGIARACIAEKNWEDIVEKAPVYLEDTLRRFTTFKVEAKRSDKRFPMKSPEICNKLGAVILEKFPHLSVDVHNPQVTVTVEIRDFAAYIHGEQLSGAGGIPVGSGGRAALLMSGGIDSPVAGYMMAKRGLEIVAVHFASPPYTSERAKKKVVDLCQRMTAYCGKIKLLVVPFTETQDAIREHCPEALFTIIMRRLMMQIAEKLAEKYQCSALITGESLGQVASQTVEALACTDVASYLPVLRPVIGMDKEEIVGIAQKIDTFELSILPYEDCCTVFTPRHPRIKPRLREIMEAEQAFDFSPLVEKAADNAETIVVE